MRTDQKKIIESILSDIAKKLLEEKKITIEKLNLFSSITVDRPKVDSYGDFASNIALQLSKVLNTNPRLLAQTIIDRTKNHPKSINLIEKIEIAGPGFINIWMDASQQQLIIHEILRLRSCFGRSEKMKDEYLLLEYVSANPTGPLHVGHARQAILGDTLAKIFSSQGAKVWREFYYNDAGHQISILTESIIARLNGKKPGDQDWPQDAYSGEYIQEIAEAYSKQFQIKKNAFYDNEATFKKTIQDFAITYLRLEQDHDLASIGVKFDEYFLESSLHQSKKVQEVINKLKISGYTYEQDNAVWLKTTCFGDDKDRVMIKNDGSCTYFVPDIAYHVEKWKRGYTKAINIQGSDHHSTITRVRAGLQALKIGIPTNYPSYILHSMVRVTKNGEEVKISKRAGSYVTIRDLVEWSAGNSDVSKKRIENSKGKDAVRFFLASRKPDTEFTFDVDLAIQQNEENPVYYVQYAHARICSILDHWGQDTKTLHQTDLAQLIQSDSSQKLIRTLRDFPSIVERASKECSPHHIAFYARNLASNFHSFYNTEHVLVANEKEKLAKLALLVATKQVLANALSLIGVSTPIKM